MATKNPFGALNVAHDDDDDTVQTVSNSQVLFQTPQEVKKKKKIRPEEKKKLEEEQNQQTPQPQNEEGFSEVRKRPARSNKLEEEGDQDFQRKDQNTLKNKGAFHPRNNQRGRGGKRLFDRHSGTGRGKEISKQGAGGKTTWGNDEQLAVKEVEGKVDYVEDDYNYNDEDKYFNIAVQDSVAAKNKPAEEKKVEETTTQNIPETNQETTPTPKEETPQDNNERRNRKDKKKRRKEGEAEAEEEEKKEAKPEVPDNSVSYKEYKELKSKTVTQAQQQNVIRKEDPNLKPTSKKSNQDDLGIFASEGVQAQNKKLKTKEKKVDPLEAKLNQLVSSNVLEGKSVQASASNQQNNQENRGGQGNRGNQGRGRGGYNKKPYQQSSGLNFGKEAFPEL